MLASFQVTSAHKPKTSKQLEHFMGKQTSTSAAIYKEKFRKQTSNYVCKLSYYFRI